MPRPPNLSDVGHAVRESYTAYRKLQHPKYNPGPRWNTVWNKLGHKLATQSIPIAEFMAVQFKHFKPFPMPNHLLSEAAVERYEQNALRNKHVDGERRLQSEINYVKTRKDIFSKLEMCQDERAPFSPAFRVCIAGEIGAADVVERFRQAAVTQLTLDPEALCLYRKYLPGTILEAMDE